MTHPESDYKII